METRKLRLSTRLLRDGEPVAHKEAELELRIDVALTAQGEPHVTGVTIDPESGAADWLELENDPATGEDKTLHEYRVESELLPG